ncbi:hypothetical protein PMAYCL1PPCAC_14306, partial [Pristionchus mayeri]
MKIADCRREEDEEESRGTTSIPGGPNESREAEGVDDKCEKREVVYQFLNLDEFSVDCCSCTCDSTRREKEKGT